MAAFSDAALALNFNTAGGAEAPMVFVDQPEEAFDRVVDTTVKGIWLCSQESSFMVGQALMVDGGYTAQ